MLESNDGSDNDSIALKDFQTHKLRRFDKENCDYVLLKCVRATNAHRKGHSSKSRVFAAARDLFIAEVSGLILQ